MRKTNSFELVALMFNFKLQTILDVRKTIEDKALYDFTEQQKELQKEEGQLLNIQMQINSLIDVLKSIKGKPVNIFDIAMNAAEIKNCMVNENTQKKRVEEAIELLEMKKVALLEAMKNRKAMEIVKAQHREKYMLHMNRLEQNASDEITIARHNRREEG